MDNHVLSPTMIFTVFLVASLHTLHFVHTADRVRGTVSVPATDHTDGQSMPQSLSVKVSLGGSDVHLRLEKRTSQRPDVPVYTLGTDGRGQLLASRVELAEPQLALYLDVEREAAFGVFQDTDSNGAVSYRLQGLVHSAGNIYNIKTTRHSLTPRHRKLPHHDNANDVNNPNSDSNDGRANGGEVEEEEEFEVEVFSETAALGADALPRPAGRARKVITEHTPLVQPITTMGRSHPAPSLPAPLHTSTADARRRPKRQVIADVHIDVVALVDYGVYKAWYDRSTQPTASLKHTDALENIRRYYAFVMNGVDLLYRTITSVSYGINVHLVSVVVASTTSASQWSERHRVSATPWDQVDANVALEDVRQLVDASDSLPAHDHLMAFVGYDLSDNSTGTTKLTIQGLAFTGTVCEGDGRATSLVEDLGGFQCVVTAAHELGHGLSAEHDGDQNVCSSSDRYVMSAGTFTVTSANRLNPWRFSSCSVNYFNTFFRNTVQFSSGRQCLYNSLTADLTVTDVTSQQPGQLYGPDEQCRQIYGPNSRMCRGSNVGDAAGVCSSMYCLDPATTNTCYEKTAARGTTCGNQKKTVCSGSKVAWRSTGWTVPPSSAHSLPTATRTSFCSAAVPPVVSTPGLSQAVNTETATSAVAAVCVPQQTRITCRDAAIPATTAHL